MRLRSAAMIDVEKAAWEKGYNWFNQSQGEWWYTEWTPTEMKRRNWQEQLCLWDRWERPAFSTLGI